MAIPGAARRRGGTAWLERALLAALSTAAALGLAELVLRHAPLESGVYRDAAPRQLPSPEVASILRQDAETGIALRPDMEVTFMGRRVRTNAQGFRGPELREGTQRIVGIGDSVMFGWGVDEAESYMRLLEADLRSRVPAVEVVNTAVPGQNTVQELATLRKHLPELRPGWVIVGFVGNDFDPPMYVFEPASFLERRSWLYRLVRLRSRGFTPVARSRWRERQGLAAFAELGELSRRHGFRVLAFLYAGLVKEETSRLTRPHPAVREACEREGFLVVELQDILLDAIAAGTIETSYDIWLRKEKPIDAHPSPLGHRLIAAGLARALRAVLD